DSRIVTDASVGPVAAPLPGTRSRYFLPRLTLSATFVPTATDLPGFGVAETTRPVATVAERTIVTFPVRQRAFTISVLAAASFFPTTFGTTQRAAGVAVVVGGAVLGPVSAWAFVPSAFIA